MVIATLLMVVFISLIRLNVPHFILLVLFDLSLSVFGWKLFFMHGSQKERLQFL
jgi:hypothetical protein